MVFDLTGRRAAALAAMLLVSAGLAACTTTEGTNAFTDVGTFEREVMNTTAAGLGLIPKEEKEEPTNPRGPLVLPKQGAAVTAPTEDTTTALLPADSDKVEVDMTGLTEDDLKRLKHVRVVDVNTPDGRPLTQAELAKLTAKMKGYRLNEKRSIFVPPEQYFELSGNKEDLVCLAPNGELVPVNDPTCPLEIRKALLKQA
jgi:hypothetical protein